MKRFVYSLVAVLLINLSILGVTCAKAANVYRVYNSHTGEHLYTTDTNEVNVLVNNGWNDEGTGWVAPDSGEPVIRVYHSGAAQHLYTANPVEVDVLTSQRGWTKDNNGNALFYSGGSIPIYRLCSQSNGDHHLTTSEYEYNVLQGAGWNGEGIAFYANAEGSSQSGYDPSSKNDLGLYSQIIELYKRAAAKTASEADKNLLYSGYGQYKYDPTSFGYYLLDIDNNGTPEMVITGIDSVLGIYTIDHGNIVHVLKGVASRRGKYFLTANKEIGNQVFLNGEWYSYGNMVNNSVQYFQTIGDISQTILNYPSNYYANNNNEVASPTDIGRLIGSSTPIDRDTFNQIKAAHPEKDWGSRDINDY